MVAGVFLYGTLLDPGRFTRFARRATWRRAIPARAAGWRRVPLRGTPYPTLLRGAGVVDGVLLPRLAGDELRALSGYEGASYRLRPMTVQTRRGPRPARAWMAARWRADRDGNWP